MYLKFIYLILPIVSIGCASTSGAPSLAQEDRNPSSVNAIYCNQDSDLAMAGTLAKVSIENGFVSLSTSKGDNMGVDSIKCDSGKLQATREVKGSATIYKNSTAGLVLSFTPFTDAQGAVKSAMVSARFQDRETGKKCDVVGSFTCH